jgi:hypothetical protein
VDRDVLGPGRQLLPAHQPDVVPSTSDGHSGRGKDRPRPRATAAHGTRGGCFRPVASRRGEPARSGGSAARCPAPACRRARLRAAPPGRTRRRPSAPRSSRGRRPQPASRRSRCRRVWPSPHPSRPPVGPNRSVLTLVAGYPRSTSALAAASTNGVGPQMNALGVREGGHAASASIEPSTRRR